MSDSMSFEIRGAAPEPRKWSFRSLELAATVAYDPVALDQVMASAAAAHRAEVGSGSSRLYAAGASGRVGRADDWERQSWRVWWVPPWSWREELSWSSGETVVIIVHADVALYYVSMQGTLYTSQQTAATAVERPQPNDLTRLPTIAERLSEFPLTGFRLSAAEWEASTLGPETRLGRAPRRVRVTRRPNAIRTDNFEGPSYWPWLDHFECLVDDDLGILLELVGMVAGRPVARVTADELRVDVEIPESTFAFVPPPRTRIVHVSGPLVSGGHSQNT